MSFSMYSQLPLCISCKRFIVFHILPSMAVIAVFSVSLSSYGVRNVLWGIFCSLLGGASRTAGRTSTTYIRKEEKVIILYKKTKKLCKRFNLYLKKNYSAPNTYSCNHSRRKKRAKKKNKNNNKTEIEKSLNKLHVAK